MLLKTDRDTYFLDLSLRCAKQGNCMLRNYGSILVDQNDCVVSTGYTGVPKKRLHCMRCWRREHNIIKGRGYDKCRSVHSEQNALIRAGKLARGCNLYLTCYDVETEVEVLNPIPCYTCIKMLVNAEVKNVIYRDNEHNIVVASVDDLYNNIEKQIFTSGE